MANYTTAADLMADILFRGGEATNGTSDFDAEALRLLNRAYREMYMGGSAFAADVQENWLWLKKDPPGVLILDQVVNAGTVSVTKNSATATLSVSPAASMAGRFFRVEGQPDVFRVSAHTAGTDTLTLDSIYTQTTNATASYSLMKLEYTLASDVLRVIAPMRCQHDSKTEVEGVALLQLEQDWPLQHVESGVPTLFAPVGETKVRFNRYGSGDPSGDFIRLEYDYLARPSDLINDAGSIPVVPAQWRHILCDMALTYLYTSKNDDRVMAVGSAAKAGLMAMALENKQKLQSMSRRFGKIRVRQDNLESKRRPLRTTSGIIIG